MERVLSAFGCAENSELSILLTDDPGITQLNEHYLGHKGPTNVLSFAMSEGDFGQVNPDMLGDVVVSLDTVKSEAEQYDLDPDEHLVRLIIHGLLHLRGMHHEESEEKQKQVEELTESLLKQSVEKK